ncbi:hypothetical protein TPHA_0E01020 [Tetrapisispora phaffii CBS 4417]|uniref:Histone acetyltransferase n=1 Tax=Tetrapisispora phaffii (strain ATCC 24235 / CBS 4417 / NBRC 1672 / NRRL Y-8282 / UCD 70-5) TaxID=1071381 RepID=G8BTG8_TETPH|nr:hypothetical protein TPHA_0E01020 [Tetrapisispora phaffii CBS 4417]CCE63196.1 hypothetical protein TPHA_0E01020 [Tetrapisispora phaffii CBS 4417]
MMVDSKVNDDTRKRKRASAILRSLIIDDNVHSEISKIARENPNKLMKSKRNTTVNVNYVPRKFHNVIVQGDDVGSRNPSRRNSRRKTSSLTRRKQHRRRLDSLSSATQRSRIKGNTTTSIKQSPVNEFTLPYVVEQMWELPGTVEELNSLNNKLHYITDVKNPNLIDNNDYTITGVKIKFNPLNFLNFSNIVNRSKVEAQLNSKLHNDAVNTDFDVYQAESLISAIDNANELPYRGVIANSKDFLTSRTAPTISDRIQFKEILDQSLSASYCNANILMCNHSKAEDIDENKRNKRKKISTTQNQNMLSNTLSSAIEYIYLSGYEIKTWYSAPYPEEYNKNKLLYICQHCLKYMNSRFIYFRHITKCRQAHPPGNEVYRDGKLSIWEVDGRENIVYCQNLCLLAKLFLNSKTLYYDVEPFIFYVLTELDESDENNPKWNFVGYFSQEKLNSTDYNLSCILTLPIYQRKGYGQLLMEFSYLLSKVAYKWGTPEKPLSNLGLLSYRNLWKIKCAKVLLMLKKRFKDFCRPIGITLEDISDFTGMIPTDVVIGLEQLQVLYMNKHVVVTNSAETIKTNKDKNTLVNYRIQIDSWTRIEKICNQWKEKNYPEIRPEKLIWKPMLFGPSGGINAVGSLIETPPKPNDGDIITNSQTEDHFNKSIKLLSNFMNDDISDPRSMEQIAWDRIKDRSESDIELSNSQQGKWVPSFIEPIIPNNTKLLKKNSFQIQKNNSEASDNGTVDLEVLDNEEIIDEEEVYIEDEVEGNDEDEVEYQVEDEDDEDDGDQDEDDDGYEELKPISKQRRKRYVSPTANVTLRRSSRKLRQDLSSSVDENLELPPLRRSTRTRR